MNEKCYTECLLFTENEDDRISIEVDGNYQNKESHGWWLDS